MNPLGSWFQSVGGQPTVFTTQGGAGASTDAAPNGIPMTQQQYDDWMQAVIDGEERYREESDRNFGLELDRLNIERDKIAISRSQQEANEWYNREVAALARTKFEEDKRQFDISTAEAVRQFDLKFQETARQFDLTTEEGRRQFNAQFGETQRQFDATFGQRVKELEMEYGFKREELVERVRQFDISTEEGRRQFNENLAQRKAEFQTSASGYLPNGAPTLEREQFGNDALFKWTQEAIRLASQPQDWVKYKQFTSGVADAAGTIPGLDWQQGGQVGNTTFAGEAQPNSLGNVLGNMGVQPSGGQQASPPVTAPGTVTQPPPQGGFSTQPINQQPAARGRPANATTDPVPAQSGQPVSAVEGGVSPAIQHGQGVVPGAPAQQNDGGSTPPPGYTFHGGQLVPIAQAGAPPTGAATGSVPPQGMQFHGGQAIPQGVSFANGQPEILGYHQGQPIYKMLPGYTQPGVSPEQVAAQPGVQAGAAPAQPMNWAYQAAGMVPTGQALRDSLTPGERQIFDTADSFSRNPQSAGFGWFESQDPLTKNLLRGAAQAQGHDWETTMSRFNRSRWGGGGSSRAA